MHRWSALVAFVLALIVAVRAEAYVPPPLEGAVTDTSGKLSAEEKKAIEERLAAYRARTTNEVVVFLVGSLGGETVEDVAYGAFNTWKIGKHGKDNGVLLVIAPADRRMRIETGKGIGDKLTDLESGRILRERIAPFLKQERWADAVGAGVDAIEAALDGRPAPPMPDVNTQRAGAVPVPLPTVPSIPKTPPSEYYERPKPPDDSLPFVLFGLGIPLVALVGFGLSRWYRSRGAFRDGGDGDGTSSTSSWSSGSSDSSWSSGSSDSSWSSGSSDGGGYSGGGGESGGGGASDSW